MTGKTAIILLYSLRALPACRGLLSACSSQTLAQLQCLLLSPCPPPSLQPGCPSSPPAPQDRFPERSFLPSVSVFPQNSRMLNAESLGLKGFPRWAVSRSDSDPATVVGRPESESRVHFLPALGRFAFPSLQSRELDAALLLGSHEVSRPSLDSPHISAPSAPPGPPTRPLPFQATGRSAGQAGEARALLPAVSLPPERGPLSFVWVDSLRCIDGLILRHAFSP